MSDLHESATWTPGIYQLEETDLVEGGPEGIDNLQAKQLANRTKWLKQQVESCGQELNNHEEDADPHPIYAQKVSPAFSGIPTAPTAASGTNSGQIATTAFVQIALAMLINSAPGALDTLKELATALGNDPNFAATMANLLAAKAPLANPALTGTPTAPTAAGGTNTTQIATTAFVKGEIATLLNSAPLALDTLNELAAALGNDPNFASTMTGLLASKAPLASPALTGTPTAPTAAGGTNTTQIATTAFVQSAIAGVSGGGVTLSNVVAAPLAAVASSGVGTKASREDHAHARPTPAEIGAAVVGHAHAISDMPGLQGALDSKAPLASPVFSGAPGAPTPAAGSNNTQIATTAFVQAALASMIGTAPGALDTLNELAAALGNDPNFATTITNLLAGKQPLDATLTALSGLTTAANQLIYSTGADSFAMTALSAFVRGILGSNDAQALRTAIGAMAQMNPTLAGTALFGGKIHESVYAVPGTSGALSIDLSQGTLATVTLSGNATFSFTNLHEDGRAGAFRLLLTIAGPVGIVWPATVKWPFNVPPDFTMAGTYEIAFNTHNASTVWRAALVHRY